VIRVGGGKKPNSGDINCERGRVQKRSTSAQIPKKNEPNSGGGQNRNQVAGRRKKTAGNTIDETGRQGQIPWAGDHQGSILGVKVRYRGYKKTKKRWGGLTTHTAPDHKKKKGVGGVNQHAKKTTPAQQVRKRNGKSTSKP